MPAAPDPTPTDPVAARRRKLARLLAIGALRAATAKAAEASTQGDDVEAKPQDGQSTD